MENEVHNMIKIYTVIQSGILHFTMIGYMQAVGTALVYYQTLIIRMNKGGFFSRPLGLFPAHY